MTLNEFDIIHAYFEKQSNSRSDVTLGIGDDAAIVSVPLNHELAITTDTLVSGVHFPVNTSPYDVGYKALAVNLSDLAAMGATPAWATLAVTLPEASTSWLEDFSNGFFALADRYKVKLIGGDITKGPLNITIQALGFLPKSMGLRRDSAQVGDFIYVTHTLGDAGLALMMLGKKVLPPEISNKLNRPEPQVWIGEKLRGIANAAIDISDGLAADLSHILEKSSVGASIDVDSIPLSETMREWLPKDEAIKIALTAGDDYELCFTVPENKIPQLAQTLQNMSYTCIGKITESNTLELHYQNGKKYALKNQGYRHF